MSTLDPLTEPLVRLFLRVDAAIPTDPVLRAFSDFWQMKRGSKITPSEADMAALPLKFHLLPFLPVYRPTERGTGPFLLRAMRRRLYFSSRAVRNSRSPTRRSPYGCVACSTLSPKRSSHIRQCSRLTGKPGSVSSSKSLLRPWATVRKAFT